jgi:hypothetical protein
MNHCSGRLYFALPPSLPRLEGGGDFDFTIYSSTTNQLIPNGLNVNREGCLIIVRPRWGRISFLVFIAAHHFLLRSGKGLIAPSTPFPRFTRDKKIKTILSVSAHAGARRMYEIRFWRIAGLAHLQRACSALRPESRDLRGTKKLFKIIGLRACRGEGEV